MFIDTHCHLSTEDYDDIDLVIKENREAGVDKIIISGCSKDWIDESLELAEKYNPDNLFKKRENLEATTEVSMIEYKEQNFIQKIISKIKKLFRRSK